MAIPAMVAARVGDLIAVAAAIGASGSAPADAQRPSAQIARGRFGRVVAAHPVHAAAGVRVTRAKVQPFDRRSVAKIREYWPKQQLLVPGVAAAAQITADQVGV